MSRIIAGSRRGRRITMPETGKTRPTSDRVREALFSALASWAGTSALPAQDSLRGLAFCDLYAGSGAVGLEAASRGAGPVLLIEADRRTALTAAHNVGSLELAARVVTGRVEPLVRQPPEVGYDIAFMDPPYDLAVTAVDAVLADLVTGGWVVPDGLVVVERSRRTPELTWPPGFDEAWSRRYGDTTLYFGRTTEADSVAMTAT